MPTALVPALAVAALLPLATPRPYDNGSAQESAPAFPNRYATNFRSDIVIMGSGLVSCIEDDTALIDKLSECLQDDVSFEENVSSRTHISFGLLDEDWRHLQLLHQAMLPDNSFFKEKLILAFRALLASFYRTHSVQLIDSKVESQNKSDEYNTVGNKFELSTKKTDTTTISKTHLVVPTPTVETILDNDISNDIVYEGAGSDPKGSVVQPPVDSETKIPIVNTDGPYEVSETTFDKGSYDIEGNIITNSLYEQETTTKEINRLSKILRGLVSSNFLFTSTTSMDSQGAELDGHKNEFPFTTDDITLPGKLIEPTDLPYNQDNNEKSEGRGTDIDENELFPPPSAEAAENELNTTPNINPAADDIKINNAFITSTVDYRAVGIPTDFSNQSSVFNDSISKDIVSEDSDEQNSQATDDPIKQDFISRASTTFEVGFVTPSSDLDVEGKGHEPGYEETSITPPNSHQESRGNSLDGAVPIVPITHAAYPVSISYTASVDAGIYITDDNGKDVDIGVSSDPFALDLPQYPKGHSIEIPVTLNRTTPPADPNPETNSDMGLDKLDNNESEKNYSESNQSIISNTDSNTKKQITLATESNGTFREDDKIPIEQITTQPTKTKNTDEFFQETKGDLDINYDASVNNENYLKHLNSSETSTLCHQRGTTPSLPSDSVEDNTNYVHQTEKSRIDITSNVLISEVTKSPTDSIDLNVPELPTEISSTHDVDKNTFYSSGASDGTKEFTIPLLNGITSEEPELRGQTEQKTLVTDGIPLQGTTLSNLVSGYELDGYSNVPDDSTYKYASEDADVSLNPDPVSPPPKSKDDDISSGSISNSDENPTTAILDNDRSNSESINVAENNTEQNMLPITTNNTNWDFKTENRTESKKNLHSFSIQLPEVPKSKQEKIILNTLRIFPPSNNHILTSQPSYKYGCLSQNDCVRVGNILGSKQRRNPAVNLEKGGEDDLQFSAVDKDSVLWWHKMRALKKKSR